MELLNSIESQNLFQINNIQEEEEAVEALKKKTEVSMSASKAKTRAVEETVHQLKEQIAAGHRKHSGLLSSLTMLRNASGTEEDAAEHAKKDAALSKKINELYRKIV